LSVQKREFQIRTEQIEQLVRKLEASEDPELHTAAIELMQCLMELHGAGLERMMDALAERPDCKGVIAEIVQDDLVASLLLLHGLHPQGMESRVQRALDSVRPYLHSHGGEVELLSLEEGVLRLRLKGSCGSCSSSSETMKNAVEAAVWECAPDIERIIAEESMTGGGSAEHNVSQLVVLK
jgi:Fe-S cluster biogenesis protein NfuA